MTYEQTVYKHLKRRGMPASLLGYKYFMKAATLVADDPEIMRQITKRLYPAIAEAFNTTASRVERAMRHAVEYVFSFTDEDVLYEYFGNTVRLASGTLTNSQFLAGLVEYIKMEEVV